MTNDYPFIKACWRKPVDYTPVWLMRQAGRYMKEYRAIKEKHSFLTMCKTPELAAEITMQPINKIGVDAAIIFADILLPLEGMGIGFEFTKNDGPVIKNPIRNRANIESIKIITPEEDLSYVMEALKLVRKEVDGKVPLIGFSGAPFTLASYMIEAAHSRNYILVKSMMYNDPSSWHLLMEKTSRVITLYLKAQIAAGAQAVQLFDSWVGCLSPGDYKEFVLPHSKSVIDGLKGEGVPVIHFGTDSSTLLELMREAGGDVIGVDWRIGLDDGWKKIGYDKAIQGNLDPVALFSSPERIEELVKSILDQAGDRAGHIFNLGHGILPKTPVENVIAMVEAVHKYSKR
ncbi:MAG: uroporphyrinogen decarboxylase [Thermodesulfobacteriota bacterium]